MASQVRVPEEEPMRAGRRLGKRRLDLQPDRALAAPQGQKLGKARGVETWLKRPLIDPELQGAHHPMRKAAPLVRGQRPVAVAIESGDERPDHRDARRQVQGDGNAVRREADACRLEVVLAPVSPHVRPGDGRQDRYQ